MCIEKSGQDKKYYVTNHGRLVTKKSITINNDEYYNFLDKLYFDTLFYGLI